MYENHGIRGIVVSYRKKPIKFCPSDIDFNILSFFSYNIKANLQDGLRPNQTLVEDVFIRKFIMGTFHSLVCSEVIVKRQFNHIRIAFLLRRGITPNKIYFLIGYTEEFLANWLQCPITLEIQTIVKQQDTVFKYI